MSSNRPVPFAVWPQDGAEADARLYYDWNPRQAAEQRARDDYKAEAFEAWPITYCARDPATGQLWMVLVEIEMRPVLVAGEAREVPMPPATHVLWGGTALCEDLRLRGVPRDWPAGQRWISLADVADGAAQTPDPCEACWKKAPGLFAGLRQIGAR